jgi:hypothetical protein
MALTTSPGTSEVAEIKFGVAATTPITENQV